MEFNSSYTVLDDEKHIRPYLYYLVETGQLIPNENTYIPIHVHNGVKVTRNGEESCVDFCAYHSAIDLSKIGYKKSRYLVYSVIPDINQPSCNALCKPRTDPFENISILSSKTLVSAMLNPAGSLGDGFVGWTDTVKGDTDVICTGQFGTVKLYSVDKWVQKQWSNERQSCIAQKLHAGSALNGAPQPEFVTVTKTRDVFTTLTPTVTRTSPQKMTDLASPSSSSSSSLSLTKRFPIINILRNLIVAYFLFNQGSKFWAYVKIKGLVGALKGVRAQILQTLMTATRSAIPGANKLVQAEVQKSVKSLQSKLVNSTPNDKKYTKLPETGMDLTSLRGELSRYQGMGHVDWKAGKVSGAIYHGGEELSALITEAYGLFNVSNPLHPEIFPGVRKMEAEVVSMVLRMYNAPSGAVGTITSGGTESLLMAIKTYREMGRALKGITEPEMIAPVTIHAAFDKAASYFNIKLVHIPIDSQTGKVDLKKVANAINKNTIMLAGSAPNFPHGIIDDIPALAALAKKHKIGMHVDACLGGFIVPFANKAGFPLPHPCDFTVDGVTSISVDTHKYGFAPKGSSVIMYRAPDIRDHQYFIVTDWPGGVYASPAIAGSRPGALIAGCWAAMMRMGEKGYVETTKAIIGAARKIVKGIETTEGLRVIGNPVLSVVAFESSSPNLNVYAVGDLLSRKGWHLNMLQFPQAIHIACTYLTVPVADQLVADIKEAVEAIKKDPKAGNGEVAAIYGTAANVPDRSIIADVAKGFLDALTML
ncbi:hypothetical protein HDV05_001282 [Chytridiales sp. JEL 0842]|nr:hypothetical protein HDV05_001282 [Chytridiales sp. JEL 0842]